MNSYQTVNAAFVAAGLTKQAAVEYGRRFEASLYDPFGRRSLFDMLVQLQRQQLGYFENLPAFPNAPRVDHDPVGRWNAEDKERQLALKRLTVAMAEGPAFENVGEVHDSIVYERKRGTGGIAAAAAGATSQPSYVVRQSYGDTGYEVVNTRTHDVHLRFKQRYWAKVSADAYNAGQTPRQFMDTHGIDHTKWTLA